jgi:topoisomerase-4 subunit A
VLSKKGWIRAAKGHDIDGVNLSYKAGDAFAFSAPGKSNQPTILLDSTGRSYTLATHALPSARGQGEPISGRVNPPPGAEMRGLLIDEPAQQYLLASDAGYGFIGRFDDMVSKNKAGKAVLSLPKNAQVLPPAVVHQRETDYLAAVSNEGRLLVFPVRDLPELAKGKGNKIINIPSARASEHEEYMIGAVVLGSSDTLVIFSGKRKLKLKGADLEHYLGERGRRGNKLPRGFQSVASISVE